MSETFCIYSVIYTASMVAMIVMLGANMKSEEWRLSHILAVLFPPLVAVLAATYFVYKTIEFAVNAAKKGW